MDWNARYQDGDTPWDKGIATPIISELLENQSQYFQPGSNILLPGCGRGHDAMPLIQAGLQVTGVDISATAISDAAKNYLEHSHTEWHTESIFQMPQAHKQKYDLIWEHTCYCAIAPSLRIDYVDSIVQLLKPNSYFIGVFFVETDKPIDQGPPYFSSRDEVYTNFNRQFHLVWEGKPKTCYKGREGKEWVMIWRKPITA